LAPARVRRSARTKKELAVKTGSYYFWEEPIPKGKASPNSEEEGGGTRPGKTDNKSGRLPCVRDPGRGGRVIKGRKVEPSGGSKRRKPRTAVKGYGYSKGRGGSERKKDLAINWRSEETRGGRRSARIVRKRWGALGAC